MAKKRAQSGEAPAARPAKKARTAQQENEEVQTAAPENVLQELADALGRTGRAMPVIMLVASSSQSTTSSKRSRGALRQTQPKNSNGLATLTGTGGQSAHQSASPIPGLSQLMSRA